MKALACGGGLFLLSLALQLAWWKISLPRRQSKTLLSLMLAVQAAGTAAAFLFSPNLPFAPSTLPQAAHSLLLGLSLSAAWLITYSAVEADSPSLVLMLEIRSRGDAGISREELLALAGDDILLAPRIRDLVTDRMAALENGVYRPTAKGRALATIFKIQRALLGLGKGG